MKDVPEMLFVGKRSRLFGQKDAAGIHEIYARQAIFHRDSLRADVLLDRHRIVRAALDGGIVGDH